MIAARFRDNYLLSVGAILITDTTVTSCELLANHYLCADGFDIMTDNEALEILEFDKIRTMLAGKSLTPAGKELALAIEPLENNGDINRILDETTEMVEILSFEEPFPLQRIDDTNRLLHRVATEGTYLDPSELLKIKIFVEICGRLKKYIRNKSDKYPLIAELISKMSFAQEIIDAIDKAIDKTGEVKDSASPELRKIRIERSSTRNKILSRLEKIIGARTQRGTYQDDIITVRDGRYVIPIAEGDFTTQSGVVHDRSKSGATLYVEPLETVELNNRLRKLDSQEEKEITRILISIADLIREELASLQASYDVYAGIDFIHTRGQLSLQLDANRPMIISESRVRLIDARHPLLLTQAEDRASVVPLSLSLGGKFDALVVTGPNTGGKTVALKTLGILILMARSGLHIPASEKTEIGSITRIFADIGDEQSIELSLSTFSSHLSRIIRALQECDDRSLILLDEIGAGTDPKEGSALAEAVLIHILDKGAKAFVTTHYSALKTLPEKYPRIENASLEFDRSTLRPSYRFKVGLPGSSYAIEVAKRLGMPDEIIARSEKIVGTQEHSLSRLIEKLESELRLSRQEKFELDRERQQAEELRKNLNERESGLRTREETLKRREVDDARELVESTRKKLEDLVRSIREKQADKETVKEAHGQLREMESDFTEQRNRLEPRKRRKKEKLQPGDDVFIETLQTSGSLLEYQQASDSWRVQVGNMISTVKSEFLSKHEQSDSRPALPSDVNYAPFEDISTQISVIGLTVDEAIEEVDRFLDRVAISNLDTVYILHGKGTGALRRAIKDFLSRHHLVADFRLGYVSEGSSGVTVVTIKRD